MGASSTSDITTRASAGDTPEQKVKKIYAYVEGLDNLTYKPQRTQQEQEQPGVGQPPVRDLVDPAGPEQALSGVAPPEAQDPLHQRGLGQVQLGSPEPQQETNLTCPADVRSLPESSRVSFR